MKYSMTSRGSRAARVRHTARGCLRYCLVAAVLGLLIACDEAPPAAGPDEGRSTRDGAANQRASGPGFGDFLQQLGEAQRASVDAAGPPAPEPPPPEAPDGEPEAGPGDEAVQALADEQRSREAEQDEWLERLQAEPRPGVETVRRLWEAAAEQDTPDVDVLAALEQVQRSHPDSPAGRMAADALADFQRRQSGELLPEEDLARRLSAATAAPMPVDGDDVEGAVPLQVSQPEPPPALVAEAMEMAGDESSDRREAALNLLHQHQPDAAVEVLANTLVEGSPDVRLDAVQRMWRMAGDERLDHDRLRQALYHASLDPSPAVAGQAAAALQDLDALEARQRSASEEADLMPPLEHSGEAEGLESDSNPWREAVE